MHFDGKRAALTAGYKDIIAVNPLPSMTASLSYRAVSPSSISRQAKDSFRGAEDAAGRLCSTALR